MQPSAPARCSACKLVCFASRDHQRRGWNAGHREECAALRAAAPRVPPTAVRLALRCALRHWAAQRGAADGAAPGAPPAAAPTDRFGEVLGLQHHWARLQDGAKLQYAQMGALAHGLLRAACPQAAELLTPRDMAQLIARFGANSHTIRRAGTRAGGGHASRGEHGAQRSGGVSHPSLLSRPRGPPPPPRRPPQRRRAAAAGGGHLPAGRHGQPRLPAQRGAHFQRHAYGLQVLRRTHGPAGGAGACLLGGSGVGTWCKRCTLRPQCSCSAAAWQPVHPLQA